MHVKSASRPKTARFAHVHQSTKGVKIDTLASGARRIMATTLDALRKQARSLGLTGYSKLRKAELEKLIADARQGKRSTPAKSAKSKTTKTISTRPARPRRATRATATPSTRSRDVKDQAALSTEEQIESSKYRLTPPGRRTPAEPVGRGLHEPIEHLPAQRRSALYLLPQKPGVLHASWQLSNGELGKRHDLVLRLSVLQGDVLHILEDVPVRTARGHWYFQVPAALDHAQAFLALGYEHNGQFVSAIAQGIARIPSLYAASRIDRRWWISDARFREMYLRAGGFRRGEKLGWNASISSR